MADQSVIDYSLMAGVAYKSTTKDENKFPVPDSWYEITNLDVTKPSGFEAVTFRRTNADGTQEIVISFAGTYIKDGNDILADITLAKGEAHQQLFDAAEYYLKIKALYPNATITFTGHSLGGGLAALMGVFFNIKAVTFDQAPFGAAATWLMSREIKYYLLDLKDASGQPVYTEEKLRSIALELFNIASDTTLQERAAKVSGWYVTGQFLDHWPLNSYTIGNQIPIDHGATDVSQRGQVFAWLLLIKNECLCDVRMN